MLQKLSPGTFKRRRHPDGTEPVQSKPIRPDGAKDYQKAKLAEEMKTARLRALRKARDAEGPTVNCTKPVYRQDDQAR